MTWNRAEILHLRHPIRSHDSSQFLKMLNNRESQIFWEQQLVIVETAAKHCIMNKEYLLKRAL